MPWGIESSEMSWYQRWSDEVFRNCVMDLFNNFCFRGILNLQLVASEEGYPERILRRSRSPHLMWLRWDKCENSCLPSWIPMESLRVLEISGAKLKLLWQHESQAPLQLRELKIWSTSFSNFPRSIGKLKQLEKIAIYDALIETVPDEFCDLPSLKYLELIHCSKMMSLPDSFGDLTNLQHIDLSGALSLRMLPDAFGNLTNLRHIDLCGALRLQMLPNSFGNLTRLQHLGLGGCRSLTFSNETFGNITTLEYIDISGCCSVKALPPQGTYQRALQNLNVRMCIPNLQGLPSGMCITNLQGLPSGIGDVSKTEHLVLGGEPLLEMRLTLVCRLKNLKCLGLFDCPELKCLPDSFGWLIQLTQLTIWNCGIEYLPQELMGMKNLEILIIENCLLRELPFKKAEGELDFSDGQWMPKLKLLQLVGTQTSEVIFDEGVCPNLQYLFLVGCFELRGIKGLCRLAKLQYLCVSPRVKVEALVEQYLISYDESDVTERSEYLFQKRRRIRGQGPFIDAMRYVDKCHKILNPEGLGYLTYPPIYWVT